MFGNVKNYSDLRPRKDCLGDARYLTDWDIRICIRISSALSVTAREGVEPRRLLREVYLSGQFYFLSKASEMPKGENEMSQNSELVTQYG